MKVFLSWSKDLSRGVAQYFAEWLPSVGLVFITPENHDVIQECSSPFISSDIDKGEPWFETITTSLATTDIDVWLNFEAGAMLNKFGKSGICPVLVNLKKGDYDGPLKNLQLTELTDETDVRQLLGTINKKCANPLDPVILDKMLAVFWSDLQGKISELIAKHANSGKTTNAKRNMDDKVDELLSLVRGIAAKETLAEEKLAERTWKDFVLTSHLIRPSIKAQELREGIFTFRDVINDQAFDRIANQEGTRRERLERFAEQHGSVHIILNSSKEDVTLVDVFEMGNGRTELLIKAKDTNSVQTVPLEDVTVIPF